MNIKRETLKENPNLCLQMIEDKVKNHTNMTLIKNNSHN